MVADGTPAIQVVLAADAKRTQLIKEKEELELRMTKKNKTVDMDRLNDVYDELKAIGADQAEPKARRLVRQEIEIYREMVFKPCMFQVHFIWKCFKYSMSMLYECCSGD